MITPSESAGLELVDRLERLASTARGAAPTRPQARLERELVAPEAGTGHALRLVDGDGRHVALFDPDVPVATVELIRALFNHVDLLVSAARLGIEGLIGGREVGLDMTVCRQCGSDNVAHELQRWPGGDREVIRTWCLACGGDTTAIAAAGTLAAIEAEEEERALEPA